MLRARPPGRRGEAGTKHPAGSATADGNGTPQSDETSQQARSARQGQERATQARLLLGQVPVELGEKVPAFLLRDDMAEFGWVFWEKFREGRARKLFGSVHRNDKGDWAIQLGEGSREPVYVCLAGKTATDPDRPSSLG